MGCLAHLTLLFSTAVEASTVALVMTGVISPRMITEALGSLPQEEQQGKAGHTIQWAEQSGSRHCWRRDLIAKKKSTHEHTRDSPCGVFAGSQGYSIADRSLRQKTFFRIIVLMIPFLALESLGIHDLC